MPLKEQGMGVLFRGAAEEPLRVSAEGEGQDTGRAKTFLTSKTKVKKCTSATGGHQLSLGALRALVDLTEALPKSLQSIP